MRWLLLILKVLMLLMGWALFSLFRSVYNDCPACSRDAALARRFLGRIADLPRPDDNWRRDFWRHDSSDAGDATFYFFKVWFTEAGITRSDIDDARVVSALSRDGYTMIELKCGALQPEFSCEIHSETSGARIRATFPMNNCFFRADKNNDGTTDSTDVALASKEHAEHHQQ
jgi:hypothetical protein